MPYMSTSSSNLPEGYLTSEAAAFDDFIPFKKKSQFLSKTQYDFIGNLQICANIAEAKTVKLLSNPV